MCYKFLWQNGSCIKFAVCVTKKILNILYSFLFNTVQLFLDHRSEEKSCGLGIPADEHMQGLKMSPKMMK